MLFYPPKFFLGYFFTFFNTDGAGQHYRKYKFACLCIWAWTGGDALTKEIIKLHTNYPLNLRIIWRHGHVGFSANSSLD